MAINIRLAVVLLLLGLVTLSASSVQANSISAVRAEWIGYVSWWDPPVTHWTGHVAPQPDLLPFSKDVTQSQVASYLAYLGVNVTDPSCAGSGLIKSGCPGNSIHPDTGYGSYFVCDCDHPFLTYVVPVFGW